MAPTSMAAGTPPLNPNFWIAVEGASLAQGDLLPNCLVPEFHPDFRTGSETPHSVIVREADLIVVTQSCDLENRKANFVALCPVNSLTELTRINTKFAGKVEREEIRKGRHEGLHILASPTNPENNQDALVVDFRQIFSLPIEYLSSHAGSLGSRWRLQSPFLEHFSQSFARFFMRVGLPAAIKSFK